MKPRLFDKNETTFTHNGKGVLDFISCIITEERNGQFELEGEISENVYHSSEIEMNSIIQAKVPDQTDLQLFRVYKLTKGINGRYEVCAQHISYQLSFIPVEPFSIAASPNACASTLSGLKSHALESCPFNFTTDVETVASFALTKPASIRNCLGGAKGSVLDQFGGEYKWNNYNISLLKNRGKTAANKDVTLRYGKDIIDLNQEELIANTVTGVVPYWVNTDGSELLMLSEKIVNSQYASAYPFKRTIPYDFSQDFQEKPTQAQLRAHAQAYVNQAGMGIPTVSIKVKLITLEQEVANNLQRVKLCDNIGVEFVKLGISTTAKVVKYEYNVLAERYESIEVGTIRATLAETISNTDGLLAALSDDTRNMFAQNNQEVTELVDNATAWLTGADGYVMAIKNSDGTWKELLFMSTNDATDPTANVLRINENGLGFSSTGVGGPYTQAWTLDGRMVIGGTNVPSLTVYDNNNQILFQISSSGMQWNADNSSMTTAGVFTVRDTNNNIVFQATQNGITVGKGTISGATLTVGGNNNVNGQINVNDASSNNIGTWNKDGLDVKKGTITGSTVRTAASGTRMQMDSSSTLKGMRDDQMHNAINMMQGSTNQMTIDADTQLNIRTPALYITNESAGMGSATVYGTQTDSLADFQNEAYDTGRLCYRILDVRKFMPADDPNDTYKMREVNIADAGEGQGAVKCTLPVFLKFRYKNERRMHGMVLSGTTAQSFVV